MLGQKLHGSFKKTHRHWGSSVAEGTLFKGKAIGWIPSRDLLISKKDQGSLSEAL